MTDEAIGRLRRRMIEDMSIRKFVAKTQHDYVHRVKTSPGSSADLPIRPRQRTCAKNGTVQDLSTF